MTIDYLAILAAAVASWLAGAAWYGILGKSWMAALGWTEKDVGGATPVLPMVISFVGEIVMAAILLGILAHMKVSGVQIALMVAAFIWLGFVVTTIAVNNAFQRRGVNGIMLTLIDSGHWLVVLLIQGLVLGLMM